MISRPLCRQLEITPRKIDELLTYVGFGSADEKNLQLIHTVIPDTLESIIERFYGHIACFEHLQHFIGDEATVNRLKQSLRKYILTLGTNVRDLAYVEDRLRIGHAHERIGLRLKWYLGVYPLLFESIAAALTQKDLGGKKLPKLLCSLQKALVVDSVLVAETYHLSSTRRLEEAVEQERDSRELLHRAARMDGLTRVLNKSAVTEALDVEFLRCRRARDPFSLLFLDLDRFKRINDVYGHRFGDFILQRMVELTRSVLRPRDIIGRYGGDEILVGLSACSSREAVRIAERIRLKVALATLAMGEHSTHVTLSIGIAALTSSLPGLAAMIEQADELLRRAKTSGRNRTCASIGTEPVVGRR
jgi:diguanylate cyclase (GGDEF)-like protein